MSFPQVRLRRLRSTPLMRDFVAENHVSTTDLVYPMFVTEARESSDIAAMPGIRRHTIDDLCNETNRAMAAGIRAVMLFGIPNEKDDIGSQAYAEGGIVARAIRALRLAAGNDLLIIPDVCLCEYTSHGHCGVLRNGMVVNDLTLELLARASVCYAEAGASVIAPSDMMDGRVGFIRDALDSEGFENLPIMAYSAKYASAFYGPFREAAGSTPEFGDRRSYQMDPSNGREALREIYEDIAEGADIIMVKPGLPYLDILREARNTTDVPLAVYNVSGEYSMVKAAAQSGWIDEGRVVDEMLTSFKRAGADIILSYHAVEWAERRQRS